MEPKARLRTGLDEFLKAMRQFIRTSLISAYPSTWWQDGVEPALPLDWRSDIERRSRQNPTSPKLDLIEPRELKAIVERNFSKLAWDWDPDYREVRARLDLIVTARNLRIARGPADIPDEVVDDDLAPMKWILERAGLKEAVGRINALRSETMTTRAGGTQADATVSAPPPATAELPSRKMDGERRHKPRGKTIQWSAEQANALKRRRTELDLTQARVGELSGIGRRRYSWIEFPNIVVAPRLDELESICRVLRVDIRAISDPESGKRRD